jgi:predicted nucleic acid-binding protein
MSLANLQDGDRVFIDANIFIYHFGGRSLECKALLERYVRRALLDYTFTPVLAEVLHRCMVAEVIAQAEPRMGSRLESCIACIA